MASQAYVFVYVTPGKVDEVTKGIARLAGVKSAHACWGRPDVIAFVEAANPKGLGPAGPSPDPGSTWVEATDTRILVKG